MIMNKDLNDKTKGESELKIDGVSKNEPVETNKQGGKQSVSPYAMHLVDFSFMYKLLEDDVIISYIAGAIWGKYNFVAAFELVCQIANYTKEQALLKISEVLKEGAEKYRPNNWRLIPQEEHVNHALVHYLAYKIGDTQDDHLEHCLCRLMFAFCTQKSDNFEYTKFV